MTQEEWTQEETDLHQCNDYMIINYVHKIASKWGHIQGIEIKDYDDLCDDGKKEIDDWYSNFPRDLESIKKIIAKRGIND